ncbi:MAG: stage III sporulation protein AA, partial [Lachnospiraceae bacterium]|nr:stage III sporulation protein AA [Lachnospiraceae bacterium]
GIYNTLIVSPPGAGKTTLLRDCIRSISYGRDVLEKKVCRDRQAILHGWKVGLVDERSEIAASYHGIPQNDVGPRTDVLDGCNKPEGIQMLLRTMSPEIIAMDELGTEEDFMAVEQAAYAGCKVIGTIHAGSVKELHEKPILKKWCEKELFERFIFIEKGEDGMRKYKVYNNRWELLC